jgi:2-(3-amino-3-carboxypropyl)histidine synthase
VRQQVPDAIASDPELQAAIAVLPPHYSFEVPKTVWRLAQARARRVALQLPEGLLMFALALSDILCRFARLDDCFVLGDVAYGACCVDDLSASALGADFLVHYGHSCLVPVDSSALPCLYVFVEIRLDVPHLVETVELNFAPQQRIAMAGTIQFGPGIHAAKAALSAHFCSDVIVPQEKPLSGGEVLGCTAPSLPPGSVDSFVFVSDGRFHMEAFMIANPHVKAFRSVLSLSLSPFCIALICFHVDSTQIHTSSIT